MCGHISNNPHVVKWVNFCPICFGKPGRPNYKIKMKSVSVECGRCKKWFTPKKGVGTTFYCDECKPIQRRERALEYGKKMRQERQKKLLSSVTKKVTKKKFRPTTGLLECKDGLLWTFKEAL